VFHEELSRSGDRQFWDSRPNDPRFKQTARLSCPNNLRTLIITYIGLLEELQPLKTALLSKFGSAVHYHLMKDQYIEDHYFLEISHAKANKKEGLRMWAELVGCKPEEVTVFGDNLNDTGMFEIAGNRVAVANAHPDLFELSTHTVPCNDDDGVAQYIEGIVSYPRTVEPA
jgi:5-amino-6-(5-phospho-D-ribitylamino)uracil phosphatase